jgi:hypothetical protein
MLDLSKKSIWNFKKGTNTESVYVEDSSGKKIDCHIGFAVERVVLSFDETVLMISDAGYVKVDDLLTCESFLPRVHFIPPKMGYLVDFNSRKNRYITLIAVSASPTSYLAFIGESMRRKNLVSLPGAYDKKKTRKVMVNEAFSYSENSIMQPKISIDGKYASVEGDVDCSIDAYPGVWDIEKDRKIFFFENFDIR